jgi:hypothetical protein
MSLEHMLLLVAVDHTETLAAALVVPVVVGLAVARTTEQPIRAVAVEAGSTVTRVKAVQE